MIDTQKVDNEIAVLLLREAVEHIHRVSEYLREQGAKERCRNCGWRITSYPCEKCGWEPSVK